MCSATAPAPLEGIGSVCKSCKALGRLENGAITSLSSAAAIGHKPEAPDYAELSTQISNARNGLLT